jgi:hypothetical protein
MARIRTAGPIPPAVQHAPVRYEKRIATRQDILQEIRNALGGLTLPAGPSGMVGVEREYRRYFTSSAPGEIAKLLYRGLCHEEHRATAEWFIEAHTKEEIGLVTHELDRLKKVAALPIPKRMRREPKTLLQVYVTNAHINWLRDLEPEASMSENIRTVLDAAMGVES